jgi:type I restriction enzyme S subunit
VIAGLKPYAEMKKAGSSGHALVPAHWTVRKLRTILRPAVERNRPDLPLLSVVRERGVVLRNIDSREENHNFIPEDLSNYKAVHGGQFVMNKMKAWQGSYGVSKQEGIVSPAYFTFDLNGVDEDFFHVAIRSAAYISFFNQASDGVRIGQWDLSQERMKEISFLIPPPDEQAAIARFLGHVDRRIRRSIAGKLKVIQLLEEQKQAFTHRAVTRGLDPNVRLKPSGVEWLGDVPEHWGLVPNRSHLKIRKELVGDRHGDYQLLSLTKGGVIIRDVSENKGKFSADLGTSQEVRIGDLVFCLFDVPETPRTVGLSRHEGMITSAYTVFECQDASVAQFLEVFYIAMDDRKLLSPLYSGLRNTIPRERFLAAKTPIPPPAERAAIVSAVDFHMGSLNAIIDRTRRELALLREYRARLVADVVTGKLDVCSTAALLCNSKELEVDELDGDDADQDGEEVMQAAGDQAA